MEGIKEPYARETCSRLVDKEELNTCIKILKTHNSMPSVPKTGEERAGELYHWLSEDNFGEVSEENSLKTGVSGMLSLTANPKKMAIMGTGEDMPRSKRLKLNYKELAEDKPILPVYYKEKGKDVPDDVLKFYRDRGINDRQLGELIKPGEGFKKPTSYNWNIPEEVKDYSFESEWKSLEDIEPLGKYRE